MLKISPIRAFSDNYIWLLRSSDPDHRQAWVVDPGDASVVERALDAADLQLGGVLVTHHHPDHIGGLAQLSRDRDLPIYGPDNPAIGALTTRLGNGDSVDVLGTRFEVMTTPGHTLDHIVYFAASHEPPLLFSGDTLFAAGCGRLFEGQPAQMLASLARLRTLPATTRVYCAHEYTLANLSFARAVEPDNEPLTDRIRHCEALRAEGTPTVPSRMEDELASNPFMRWDQPSVCEAAEQHAETALRSDAEVFATIRQWKDRF